MARLTIADRLDALAQAVRAGRGVLPGDVAQAARAVEENAGHRLRLSELHTVVAFAGSTGSGKSSLVNAVVGREVAEVDVLRPTTAHALAVVRGAEGSGPLLDWLEVSRRVVVGEADGDGLILLDLPDHDSVRTEHRLEAERLVALVDLMVWVMDPQKYADAAVHERYLRTLGAHEGVVLVVLNQVDRLSAADRAAAVADLRRLLAQDGLRGVRVLEVSAATGEGVQALVAALDDAAARHVAARERVEADVVTVATRIDHLCGAAPHRKTASSGAPTRDLVDALADAAGVPAVTAAVRGSSVLAARRATGWPPTRWFSRVRADPLRALHLPSLGGPVTARRRDGEQGTGSTAARPGPDDESVARTSLRPAGAAEAARARGAVRTYLDAATDGAPAPWVLAARSAVRDDTLGDALDRAVAGAPLLPRRRPRWWGIVGGVQWLLLAVLVVGLGWLGALAGLDALRLPVPTTPEWGTVPVPTVAAVGGAAAGLLVAGLARLAAHVGARRHARRATAALRSAVAAVAERVVTAPVADVMDRLALCRTSAQLAAGPARRTTPRGAR